MGIADEHRRPVDLDGNQFPLTRFMPPAELTDRQAVNYLARVTQLAFREIIERLNGSNDEKLAEVGVGRYLVRANSADLQPVEVDPVPRGNEDRLGEETG